LGGKALKKLGMTNKMLKSAKRWRLERVFLFQVLECCELPMVGGRGVAKPREIAHIEYF